MDHLSDEQIRQISRDREVQEVLLAKELEEELKSYIRNFRTYVKTAIDWILTLNELFLTRTLILKTSNLTLWHHYSCRPTVMNLQRHVMTQIDKWTLSDCSDLIRLWGEVVEQAAKEGVGLKGLAQAKLEQRDGVAFDGEHRARITRESPKPRIAREEPEANPFGVRDRPTPIPAHLVGLLHFAKTSSVMYPLRSRGIPISALAPHDTVRKIDMMYGLTQGMSISGTTTDSIFFLDHMIKHRGTLRLDSALTAALHLLPLATMVSRYHHTLLECALALTLPPASKMNYTIGFYTSLMPLDLCSAIVDGTELSKGVDALMSILSKAEHATRMMHVFAWTLRNRRQGVLFDAKELPASEPLFRVNAANMDSWRAMSHANTCVEAYKLWRRCVSGIKPPGILEEDVRQVWRH